jgi:hypothetical protein
MAHTHIIGQHGTGTTEEILQEARDALVAGAAVSAERTVIFRTSRNDATALFERMDLDQKARHSLRSARGNGGPVLTISKRTASKLRRFPRLPMRLQPTGSFGRKNQAGEW